MISFSNVKIGDMFWDDGGELAKKVSETEAVFMDGDKNAYLYDSAEKVRPHAE